MPLIQMLGIVLFIGALSSPLWHLVARRVGIDEQRAAAAGAGFAIFAVFVIPSLASPDWSWIAMLAFAVPCTIAAVLSSVVLSRVSHRAALARQSQSV